MIRDVSRFLVFPVLKKILAPKIEGGSHVTNGRMEGEFGNETHGAVRNPTDVLERVRGQGTKPNMGRFRIKSKEDDRRLHVKKNPSSMTTGLDLRVGTTKRERGK